MILASTIDGQKIALFIISGLLACLWFLLKYWFKKFNDGQVTIINDLGVNKLMLVEHKAITDTTLEAMEIQNQASQRHLMKEMHTLTKSMNKSFDIVLTRTEKNGLDIANLQTANIFISKEIKDLKRGKGK